MNPYMLDHPTVRANLAALGARGVRFIEPDVGLLACGYEGEGKLASLERVVEEIERVAATMPPGPGVPLGAPSAGRVRELAAMAGAVAPFAPPAASSVPARASSRTLAGVRILVTAGRTVEPIDPVRYISNHSSGRMGFAIAEEARDRGAEVSVIAGVTDVAPPAGVSLSRATTAAAMAKATKRAAASADVVIMCAAVSDWTPAAPAAQKIKKRKLATGRAAEGRILELAPTEDILASLGRNKRNGTILVGFALETARALEEGRRKRLEKHADLMVVNAAGEDGSGPGAEQNRVALVDANDRVEKHPLLPKREVARILLDKVEALLRDRRR
jgi:phosphopantothenoylcysteine decarboxylase/phosphopantothenate--cysteine ligase